MEKKLRIVFTAVLVAALVLVLGACSKEDKVEMGISTGTLKEAAQDSITISSDDGLQQFETTDNTVYDLDGMDQLNLDDVVDVEYHSEGEKMTADKVILREHVQQDLTFNGVVADVTDKSVTVTGKSLTVSFVINKCVCIIGMYFYAFKTAVFQEFQFFLYVVIVRVYSSE